MNISESCSEDWQVRIRDAVSDTTTAERRAALRDHLNTCGRCRAAYDAACDGVALLEGNPGGLPESVVQGLGADLFERLASEGALEPAPKILRLPTRRVAFAAFAAAGALAAGLFVAFLRPAAGPSAGPIENPAGVATSEFTARGGASADVGFALFCIGVDGATARIESSAISGASRAAQCRLTDRLQFTYSLHTSSNRPAPSSLALFALGPQGQLAWYWPRADGGLRLESEVRQAPLPGSFDLSVRHSPGRWRVFGVFASHPLSRESLEAKLGQGSAAAVRDLESTEGFAVLEASMEIMDAPGGHTP